VLTVPISEVNTCKKIGCLVDTIICPMQLKEFLAVGQGFENFNQTSDEEVHALLKQSHEFN
jgi:putative phosphoribosyl transferase